jgi:hypothetical protein
MGEKTHYGIISDIHHNYNIVQTAIDVLTQMGAEKFIINGDIGGYTETKEESQNFAFKVIEYFGESGLETFIQPGSHESFNVHVPVLNHLKEKYSNLIDVRVDPLIDLNNHKLLFIPGTDNKTTTAEFFFGNLNYIPTGTYLKLKEGLIPFQDLEKCEGSISKEEIKGIFEYTNLNDFYKKITDPDKTIAVCHVPRRFYNLDNCVDMAYFAEHHSGQLMPGIMLENQIKNQFGDVSKKQLYEIAKTNGFEFKEENRGNEDLEKFYSETGITKALSAHFHESSHRANDLNGNKIEPKTQVKELFWNSGWLDIGHTGILTVGDGKVSYKNIFLNHYMD